MWTRLLKVVQDVSLKRGSLINRESYREKSHESQYRDILKMYFKLVMVWTRKSKFLVGTYHIM